MAFTDGLAVGRGERNLARNTLTIVNSAQHRWFGWDGGQDSLWSQSIRPIIARDEMANSAAAVRRLVARDPDLRAAFARAFEVRSVDEMAEGSDADLQILVLVGKALAAYQETLVSNRSSFDSFRDGLVAGRSEAIDSYPDEAKRGLKLFIGEGRCNLCHYGPMFTNGEFADIGVSQFVNREDGERVVDKGRYAGIARLKASPFNLLGRFNDAPTARRASATRHIRLQHRSWGEFRVPSLRDVAGTAPYMHNGSLADLKSVVLHYSELDEERLHVHGERILKALRLSQQQVDDLVAFLHSLSGQP
jgi:cytochrome c peroxidase